MTVRAASGTYQGQPYVEVLPPDGALAPGQSVTVTLEFAVVGHHRGRHDLSYVTDVLEGI